MVLSAAEQQPQAEIVDPGVVADGGEILHALVDGGADQVLGDATQPEAAHQDGDAVGDVEDRGVGVGENLVHREALSYRQSARSPWHEAKRSQPWNQRF